jgi:hypothetical protein
MTQINVHHVGTKINTHDIRATVDSPRLTTFHNTIIGLVHLLPLTSP